MEKWAKYAFWFCTIFSLTDKKDRLILQIPIFSPCISATNSAAFLGGGSMTASLLYRKKIGISITHFDP